MNQKVEKKEYVAPQMTIIEVKSESPLLCGSCQDTSRNFFGDDEASETSYFE